MTRRQPATRRLESKLSRSGWMPSRRDAAAAMDRRERHSDHCF